jgi:hypothetical protein
MRPTHMAVLSKFAEHRPKSNDIVLVKRLTTARSLGFVEMGFAYTDEEGDALKKEFGGWVKLSRLEKSPLIRIKCVSDFAAWYLGGAFNASPEDIQENRPDLCVCVGPERDKTGCVAVSCIALWREFFADTKKIESISHLVVDGAGFAKKVQTVTGKPVGFALQCDAIQGTSRDRKGICYNNEPCIVCLGDHSAYKWSNCSHRMFSEALVCAKCRNVIWTHAARSSLTKTAWRNRHDLISPCPLCRRLGKIIRWIYLDTSTRKHAQS